MSAEVSKEVLNTYHGAGIALMIAVFGELSEWRMCSSQRSGPTTGKPTTSGAHPAQFAGTIASFVKQYGFDGVDVDYEGRLISSGVY